MKIKTDLRATHIELIKIFFKANELYDVNVCTYNKLIGKLYHSLIEISYDNESVSAEKITYMSFINSGLQNMLDSYLIQCGVSPFELNPPGTNGCVSDIDLDNHFNKIGINVLKL